MKNLNVDQVLEKLLKGNKRFYSENSTNLHQDKKRIKEITQKQNPFTVVIGC